MQSKKRIIKGSGKTPKSIRQKTQGNKKEVNNLANMFGKSSMGTNKPKPKQNTKKSFYYGKSPGAPAWRPASMAAVGKKTKKPHWANSLKKPTGKKTKRSSRAFGKRPRSGTKPLGSRHKNVTNMSNMFAAL